MLKAIVKALLLIVILFVVLYVGMNNVRDIDFNFPVAGTTVQKPWHAPAAVIFFAMFAVGLLAGTLLNFGSGKGGKKSGGGKDK